MNGKSYLHNCLTGGRVNMFKNKVDPFHIRTGYT